MSWLSNIDPRIWQAVVGGAFLSAGWFFNGSQNRRRDRRRRLERVQDVQTALMAEIGHYVDALLLFDLNETWRVIVTAMEDDHKYVPVVPSERNDTVFTALIAEVHILPGEVIEPVVAYYNQVFAIEAIIEDLRSDLFRGMDQVQRIGMYTDYIALKKEALRMGKVAVTALAQSTSLPAANNQGPAVNSRGAGPSGQS